MELAVILGLLAGFAFLMTFNNLSGMKSFVWTAIIISLVAAGTQSSITARARMSNRSTPYSRTLEN